MRRGRFKVYLNGGLSKQIGLANEPTIPVPFTCPTNVSLCSDDGNPEANVTLEPKSPQPPPNNTSPVSQLDTAVAFPSSTVTAGPFT